MAQPSKPDFAVLRFSLCETDEGKLTQHVSRCGEFVSIETAFDRAKAEALREWHEALNGATDETGRVREIRLNDTEWGYELKRDHLTVARYWVHDGRPAVIPGLQPS